MNTKENILKIINVLKKKFIKILIIITIITSLITIYSFIMPETYQATATILPPLEQGTPSLANYLQSLSTGLPFTSGGPTNRLQIYKEMLLSHLTAKFIVDSLNLSNHERFKNVNYDKLISIISNSLEANITRTGVLKLSAQIKTHYFASGTEKQEIAELTSKIVKTAIKHLDYLNKEMLSSKAKQKKEFITKVLAENSERLDSIDKKIEEFQKQNKILGLDKQTQSIIANAVNIGTELAKAEIELQTKLIEYDVNSPLIQSLQQKVNSLRRQYQKAQSGGLTPEDNILIPLSEVPTLLKTYTNLLREQKILEQVILYLETQKYQEEIQEQNDVPIIEVLDKDYILYERIAPNRSLMIILSLFLSILIVPTIYIINEYLKGNISFNGTKRENV